MKKISLTLLISLMGVCGLWGEHYQAINKGKILFYNILSESRGEMALTYRGATYETVGGEYSGEVVVPEEVERMGRTYRVVEVAEDAMRGCKGLRKVTLPSSVRRIGKNAFSGCSELTSVVMPAGIDTIHESTFENCVNLVSVVLPDSLREVETYAFKGCRYLTSLRVPKGVEGFSTNSVDDCERLEMIEVDSLNNVYASVGGMLFNKSCRTLLRCPEGKSEVYLPDSLQGIGERGLRGCRKMSHLKLPRVFYMGDYALEGCAGLVDLELPSSLSFVPEGMANGCVALDSVTLSKTTTSIRRGAFKNCKLLRVVSLPAVEEIGAGAFENCERLKDVDFPKSLREIGDGAFSGCVGLTNVRAEGKEPAKCGEGVFDPRITYKASVSVPAGSVSKYRMAGGWKGIYNIK